MTKNPLQTSDYLNKTSENAKIANGNYSKKCFIAVTVCVTRCKNEKQTGTTDFILLTLAPENRCRKSKSTYKLTKGP